MLIFQEKRNRRRPRIMKSSSAVLMSGVIVLLVFSCAAVQKEPLASGELRLLSMNVVGTGVEANVSFAVTVFFEAVGNPQIKRVCFSESVEEPYCFDESDISYETYGKKRFFQVYLPGINVGPHRVECYAEYIRNGEMRKTNAITAQISVGRR
jgi:hypothetical protein